MSEQSPPPSESGSHEPGSGESGAHPSGVGGSGVRGTAGRVSAAGARGARRVARSTAGAGRYTARQARRAADAEGAGETGLARLIELHAINAAGDAAVAISLAGTLFFQVPTGEARGQVALFLGLTMLPFAIVAPLIGPMLDRFSHGRRWAIGTTMVLRAFFAWLLAGAVITDSSWLFALALGCLVASKAYAVTKAAAVPRLRPESLTLVKSNARLSLAGVIGAAISAPIAILVSLGGAEWSLRYAFALFVLATIWAVRLPDRVDSSLGEGEMLMLPGADTPTGPRGRLRMRIPASVAFALRANCGPRFLSGFLTMFMAFLLREQPIGDWRPEILLGLVIGAAGFGSTLGVALASLLTRVNPAITVVLALVADTVVALMAALFYGLLPLILLGLTAGLSQSLAKLALDSTIQRDVRERVQTSAFARSDTTLQLAWVLGGFVGIAMPLQPGLGLGVAVAVLGAWAAFVLTGAREQLSEPHAGSGSEPDPDQG